ncbi:MAG: LVIVD repeat-containing protein [Candidatus Odinarchaeota archaeon]
MRKTGNLVVGITIAVLLLNMYLAGSANYQPDGQNIVLKEVGQVDTPGFARDVVVRDGIAFVADMGTATDTYGGFFTYNVSDPSNPTLMGHFYDGGRAHQVVLQDSGTVFVADNTGGLEIIDVTDPWHPVKIGQYDGGSINYFVVQESRYIYTADYTGGFVLILDAINQTHPVEIGRFSVEHAELIAVNSNLAYVSYDSGLIILNVTNPANITELTHHEFDVKRIQFNGNIAYMVCSRSRFEPADGFKIMDFSDPFNPVEIGSYHDGGHPVDLHVSGNTAITSDLDDGIEVLNVSDTSNITEIAGYHDGGDASDIHVIGDLIYVADGADGLEIIRITYREATNSSKVASLGFDLFLVTIMLVSLLAVKRRKERRNSE